MEKNTERATKIKNPTKNRNPNKKPEKPKKNSYYPEKNRENRSTKK